MCLWPFKPRIVLDDGAPFTRVTCRHCVLGSQRSRSLERASWSPASDIDFRLSCHLGPGDCAGSVLDDEFWCFNISWTDRYNRESQTCLPLLGWCHWCTSCMWMKQTADGWCWRLGSEFKVENGPRTGKHLCSSKLFRLFYKAFWYEMTNFIQCLPFFLHTIRVDLKWVILNNFVTLSLQPGRELLWRQHLPWRSCSQNNARS